MSKSYAVFLTQATPTDLNLISELASLLGERADKLANILQHEDQLSDFMPLEKAEQLAASIELLGLSVTLKPSAEVSMSNIHYVEVKRPIPTPKVQKVEEKKTTSAKIPLVIMAFLVLVAILWAWKPWSGPQVALPAGALAPEQPIQQAIDKDTKPWLYKDHLIRPLAQYDVKARVLAAKRYPFGRGGKLSPVDAALGWGPMSDSAILDELKISQRGRWYYVNWKTPPLPTQQIMNHSANTHLVPANKQVAKQLKRLQADDVVHLKGYLIEISATDGFLWKSSLTRLDSGNGGCELLWVDDIELVSTL